MSVLVDRKCTLAASSAAPWWVVLSMRHAQVRKILDRWTKGRQTVTLCLSLDAVRVIKAKYKDQNWLQSSRESRHPIHHAWLYWDESSLYSMRSFILNNFITLRGRVQKQTNFKAHVAERNGREVIQEKRWNTDVRNYWWRQWPIV